MKTLLCSLERKCIHVFLRQTQITKKNHNIIPFEKVNNEEAEEAVHVA